MKKIFTLSLLLTLMLLTSCIYKMPDENVCSTAPLTNNPQVTHERPRTFNPHS